MGLVAQLTQSNQWETVSKRQVQNDWERHSTLTSDLHMHQNTHTGLYTQKEGAKRGREGGTELIWGSLGFSLKRISLCRLVTLEYIDPPASASGTLKSPSKHTTPGYGAHTPGILGDSWEQMPKKEYTALDNKILSLILHSCPTLPRLAYSHAYSDWSLHPDRRGGRVTKIKFEYNPTDIYANLILLFSETKKKGECQLQIR